MADQDYPNLYADMEESAQRTRSAAIAFEHVLGGPEADLVPVNGYPNQPTIAGRVKAALDTLTAPVNAAIEAAKRFLGAQAAAPAVRADGSPLQTGDEYFNTTSNQQFLWNGSTWYVPNVDGQALAQQTGATLVGAILRSGQAGQLQQALDEINDFLASGLGASVTNVAAVKLLDKRFVSSAQTAGYYDAQDGGGALYQLDRNDTTTAGDDISVIVAGDGGRWKLNHSGRVSVKQLGLRTSFSGAANKIRLQKAASIFQAIYFPSGERFRSEPIQLSANTVFHGAGFSSILEMVTPAVWTLADGTITKQIGLLHVDSGSPTAEVNSIQVHDMTLLGTVDTEGFREHAHLVSLNGSRNVDISRCQLLGFRGDGVCLGSGTGDDTERHNFNVSVHDCVIDGINNDNRNALSVVDGVGVRFYDNVVRNCTRPDMPGAVDVEPMNPWETTQNIFVYRNYFENVGGTSGVVGYTAKILDMGPGVPEFEFLRPPTNIRFEDNTFHNCPNAGGSWGANVQNRAASANTPALDLTVRGNRSSGGKRVAVATGVGHVNHYDNTYTEVELGLFIGLKLLGATYNFTTQGNTYTHTGKSNIAESGYGIQVSTNSRLSILDEVFVDVGKADGTFGAPVYFVDGVSDHVSLEGCVVTSPLGRTTIPVKALYTHTFTPLTNSFDRNLFEVPGNDFKWKPLDYGLFTFSTAPGDLPRGRYVIVGSDAAFGGMQGVLESFCYQDPVSQSTAGSTFQRFTPTAAATSKAKMFAERKVDPNTGAWTTPHWFTGV